MEFKGKTAFVSGSTKGIGLAIANKLASKGCNIVINSRDVTKAQEIAQKISETYTVESLGLAGNVSFKEDVERIFNATIEKFQKVDILVNNAGITRDNLILRMKEEDWQAVMDTNLKSVFLTCKIFLKSLLRNNGRIINISSIVGEIGNPGQTNYAASKGGMISFTKSLAREVASRNVTVNVVAPGFIETDMTDKISEEVKNQLMKQIPLQRLGGREDIAGAVCFLASDEASYITGEILSVNGGLSM